MIDIARELESFIAGKPGWRRDHASQLAAGIAGALDGKLDWDDGAGEDWARVLLAGKAVVLACMLGPLLVVTDGAAARVAPLAAGLPVITVPTLDDVVLSCDQELLRAAFGDRAWHNPALNPERFSAAELWFATV